MDNQNINAELKSKDLYVTLQMADGTEQPCKVMKSFSVGKKEYAALMPVDDKLNVDINGQIMLYRLEEDEEHNPIVVYIEDDMEYNTAANELSKLL